MKRFNTGIIARVSPVRVAVLYIFNDRRYFHISGKSHVIQTSKKLGINSLEEAKQGDMQEIVLLKAGLEEE